MQQLLSYEDIEVNLEDNEGKTPLHLAIYNNCDLTTNRLVSHKDIDV